MALEKKNQYIGCAFFVSFVICIIYYLVYNCPLIGLLRAVYDVKIVVADLIKFVVAKYALFDFENEIFPQSYSKWE